MRALWGSGALSLSLANLLLSAIAFVIPHTEAGDFARIGLILVVSPTVVLVNLFYVVKELLRPGKRALALIALVLSVVPVLHMGTIKIEF